MKGVIQDILIRKNYTKPLRSFYYKKSNYGEESMENINVDKSIGNNDIILCTTYLSVGVDICDKYTFSVYFSQLWIPQDIEQFANRIRNNDLFIKLLGTNFFLRIDRLLDWKKKEGYQLENGLIAIGSGGLLGFGINKTPLYFPEPQTDFIFAVFANNFGFIGAIFLLSLIVIFDIRLVTIVLKSKNNVNKYIMAGIIGMLIYQQFQNIGMTLGIMPITGITLPFISYGGSSLISYMIMAGVIFNISNETIKY